MISIFTYKRSSLISAFTYFILLSTCLGSQGLAQTVAIVGGTVYPVSGPRIESASVLIVDGHIMAVGTNIDIPDGAEVYDASGMWVTPGLISASTDIGLIEIGYGSAEVTYTDDDVSARFDVRPSINPQSVLIPETTSGGVTTVFSSPSGGIVAGQGTVVDLSGETVDEMLIDSSTIVVAQLNESAVSAGHGSRAGAYGRLEQLLKDALLMNDRRADFEQRVFE